MERSVTEAIDDDRLLAFLSDLVAIPSTCGGETPAQERMAAEMEAAGLQVRTWPIDLEALRSDPDWNTECDREEALGVVGSLGDGPGPRLILNGHVDVVPAGAPEGWTSPPFTAEVRDGMVYGRGALDMKGSLACAMAALRAIAESRTPLNGQAQFQSVVGEEDGGTGTLACLLEGHTADAAIVMEPTDMVVAPAQAGALDFRITIPGRSAHGALRAEGVSALDKARSVLDALRDLERTRNEAVDDPLFAEWEIPFAISVGTVRGGEWASTVPDRLVLDGRYGLPPGEAPAEARRLFEEAIRDTAQKDPWLAGHPPRVEWWGGQFEPARIAADHRIVRTAAEALEAVRGTPARLAGMPYGSDLRLLVNRGGIPGILFGPGDIRLAHRPDECVSLRDLQDYARILAVTILRFCA